MKKEQFNEVASIQRDKSGRVYSRSTNGKIQRRSTGERAVKNLFGHAIGTIGADIDNVIRHPEMSGRYSKAELAAVCGTKTSKINSHLRNELTKKFGLIYRVNSNGKLVFEFPENSPGKRLLQSVNNYRFK